ARANHLNSDCSVGGAPEQLSPRSPGAAAARHCPKDARDALLHPAEWSSSPGLDCCHLRSNGGFVGTVFVDGEIAKLRRTPALVMNETHASYEWLNDVDLLQGGNDQKLQIELLKKLQAILR